MKTKKELEKILRERKKLLTKGTKWKTVIKKNDLVYDENDYDCSFRQNNVQITYIEEEDEFYATIFLKLSTYETEKQYKNPNDALKDLWNIVQEGLNEVDEAVEELEDLW